MKKRSSSGAGKLLLLVSCIVLAVIFWASIKYSQINGFPLFSLNF